MGPDKAKDRKPRAQRNEYKVACSARESGCSTQRRMPQQMDVTGSESICAWTHGEDVSFDSLSNPPQHDRAG